MSRTTLVVLLSAFSLLFGLVPSSAEAGRRGRDRDRDRSTNAQTPAVVADALNTSASPVFGPADATITLVVFSDFQCPFCMRLAPTLAELAESEGVRLVFKHMPLAFHQDAELAARYSWAAHQQARFWDYHDGLLELGTSSLSENAFLQLANRLELDLERLATDVVSQPAFDAIAADMALGQSIGVVGVPATFVNGAMISGAQPREVFVAAIAAERAAIEPLLAAGLSAGAAYSARVTQNLAALPAEPAPAPRPDVPDPSEIMWVPIDHSPTKGPDDALVTIIVFSEFQCPFCSRVIPTLDAIGEEFGDSVRFVFKHKPLAFHEFADGAARAAIAAQNQGAFWAYHDHLFANQSALDEASLLAVAEGLELDMERFVADMASGETQALIDVDIALADRLAARGTPTFFINGIRLRGAQPLAAFQDVVSSQLEVARAAIADSDNDRLPYDVVQQGTNTGTPTMVAP